MVGDPATNRSEKQSYIKLQCKVNSWATLPSCILTSDWKTGEIPLRHGRTLHYVPLLSQAPASLPLSCLEHLPLARGGANTSPLSTIFNSLFSRCSNWSARTPTLPSCILTSDWKTGGTASPLSTKV